MTTIIIMKLKIAPGREKEFEGLVEERSKTIKKVPGFKQVYLLRPDGSKEYRLVSWWDQATNHESWIRKESYEFSENTKHPGLVLGVIPFEVAHVVKQW